MSKYLIFKTAQVYNQIVNQDQSAFETAKRISTALVDDMHFTYNQFLYPYIDALSIKGRTSKSLTTHFNTVIAKADNFDEKNFKKLVSSNGNNGVLWRISDKKHLELFNTRIYTLCDLERSAKSEKGNRIFRFGVEFDNILFTLPDYQIREFSGKLCAFLEISSREIMRLDGEIIFLCENHIIFSSSNNESSMFKTRLSELYAEKLSGTYDFINISFNEIQNSIL